MTMRNEQELFLLYRALNDHGIRVVQRKGMSGETTSLDLRRVPAREDTDAAFSRLATSGER